MTEQREHIGRVMGRVVSSLDDSIRIHNDPTKLERHPQISKVNVKKGKCSAPRAKGANQMHKLFYGITGSAAVRLERILEDIGGGKG